jgi:hypothetical protein
LLNDAFIDYIGRVPSASWAISKVLARSADPMAPTSTACAGESFMVERP